MSLSLDHILNHIRRESLQELFVAVDISRHPPPTTSIQPIDSYVTTAGSHNAPALSFGQVLQIHGSPSSGKTTLLYFMVATCLMPSAHSSTPLEGWNKSAIVLDIDGKFSIQRLRTILLHRLGHLLPSTENLEAVVEECLKNLHIFRPSSTSQLIATVAYLPEYHSNQTSQAPLGIVALHSVDAFYWLDRFRAEQLRTDPAIPFIHLGRKLDNLCKVLGPLVVLTNWGLSRNHQGDGPAAADQVRDEVYLHSPSSPFAQFPGLSTNLAPLPLSHILALTSRGNQQFVGAFHTPGRPDVATFTFEIDHQGLRIV